MQEIDTQDYARQLLELRGDKAVAVAAEKASSFEKMETAKRPRPGGISRPPLSSCADRIKAD